MTTLELYRKHKAGEIGRDRFLYEVRRDTNLPWVTNITSYNDAVKILKNKGIISEVAANVDTDPAVDRVNPYFLKKGVQKMLSKEKELTNDSYINALNKAAKQLEANPHVFDEDMFANAKDVKKADAKLQTQEVKKNNHVDKNREMKKVKVKALKETALKALTDSLKKKDQINEDSHWKYHVGSEVHTPEGSGKITEIIGSTFTIEMADGSLKDYQANTVQHFTDKKEQEEGIFPGQDKSLPGSDGPLLQGYKMNKDGQRAISPEGLEFKVGDEAIAVDNNQKIRIDSLKIDQRRIKAGYSTGMNYAYIDIAGLEKPAGDSPWDSWKGRPFGEAVKKYMAKHKGDKEKMGKLKKAIKEKVDAIKGKNTATGEEELLSIVPGGQGTKTAQALKAKGATSVTVKSIA
jgi:hypothetical protein